MDKKIKELKLVLINSVKNWDENIEGHNFFINKNREKSLDDNDFCMIGVKDTKGG